MTTTKEKTQTRRLLRGQKYNVGETVVIGSSAEQGIIFDATPRNIIILFPETQHSIIVREYDCRRDRGLPSLTAPEYMSSWRVADSNKNFQKYFSFTQQYRGQN